MNALLYIPGIFTSTDPHKYAYISKRINPIIIISSDLDSTINFALERHVFGKSQFSPFFFVLKGLCPLNKIEHLKLVFLFKNGDLPKELNNLFELNVNTYNTRMQVKEVSKFQK